MRPAVALLLLLLGCRAPVPVRTAPEPGPTRPPASVPASQPEPASQPAEEAPAPIPIPAQDPARFAVRTYPDDACTKAGKKRLGALVTLSELAAPSGCVWNNRSAQSPPELFSLSRPEELRSVAQCRTPPLAEGERYALVHYGHYGSSVAAFSLEEARQDSTGALTLVYSVEYGCGGGAPLLVHRLNLFALPAGVTEVGIVACNRTPKRDCGPPRP